MMAYLPGPTLLYASDPFQRNQAGRYTPAQPVAEVVHAVDREDLPGERFFMMHVPAVPFAPLRGVREDAVD